MKKIPNFGGHDTDSVDTWAVLSWYRLMAHLSLIVVPCYLYRVTQRGVRSTDVFDSETDRR